MRKDQEDVLRVIREMKSVGGKAKPVASAIASHLGWQERGGGSSKRMNDALQALRIAGKIQYMKGIGWVEIESGE